MLNAPRGLISRKNIEMTVRQNDSWVSYTGRDVKIFSSVLGGPCSMAGAFFVDDMAVCGESAGVFPNASAR